MIALTLAALILVALISTLALFLFSDIVMIINKLSVTSFLLLAVGLAAIIFLSMSVVVMPQGESTAYLNHEVAQYE